MRGFSQARFRRRPAEITLQRLAEFFTGGDTVDLALLQGRGLVRSSARAVKVIGNGGLEVALTVRAHAFSQGARSAILGAGGRAILVGGEAGEVAEATETMETMEAAGEIAEIAPAVADGSQTEEKDA
jgi:hypothetical protein